jgi:metallo-beta-lactamase family protein
VESFSVHADSDELIAWLRLAKKPKLVFVVHGERQSQEHMQQRLVNEVAWEAVIPNANQIFTF